MDDLFDDIEEMLDPSNPFGILPLAAGVLDDDDDRRCACWCTCRREAYPPDDRCSECRDDRHYED